MIDYWPFKLIYKCVHIDPMYQFEHLLIDYIWLLLILILTEPIPIINTSDYLPQKSQSKTAAIISRLDWSTCLFFHICLLFLMSLSIFINTNCSLSLVSEITVSFSGKFYINTIFIIILADKPRHTHRNNWAGPGKLSNNWAGPGKKSNKWAGPGKLSNSWAGPRK